MPTGSAPLIVFFATEEIEAALFPGSLREYRF